MDPALMSVMVRPVTAPPETRTGVDEYVVDPSPSIAPSPAVPQHAAVPLSRTAHVCEPAVLMAVMVRPVTAPPEIRRGIDESAVDSLPRPRKYPDPQQAAVPLSRSAQF